MIIFAADNKNMTLVLSFQLNNTMIVPIIFLGNPCLIRLFNVYNSQTE